MGIFEITKRLNGEFQFNLKAGNGEIILTSEGYTTLAACRNGIESVRKNAADDARFDCKVARDGSPFFTLKAVNGQIIGKSEMYRSTASREKGIESVKRNAPEASVIERLDD